MFWKHEIPYQNVSVTTVFVKELLWSTRFLVRHGEVETYFCGQLCCWSTRYISSTEHKMCVLSTKLHKYVAMHEDLVMATCWKGCQLQFVYVCRQCACDMRHSELQRAVWSCGNSNVQEEGEAVRHFYEVHALEMFNHFRHIGIGRHYKENVCAWTWLCFA